MYVCMYASTAGPPQGHRGEAGLCICMYICMSICMSVCVYVCMFVSLYVCMYVCMYACMHACMPAPQGHHRATGGEAGYTAHPPATQKQTILETLATPQPSTTGPQGGGGVYPPYTMRGVGGWGLRPCTIHIYIYVLIIEIQQCNPHTPYMVPCPVLAPWFPPPRPVVVVWGALCTVS